MIRVYTVYYAVAGYSGTIKVFTDPSEEDEERVLAKARALLRRKAGGTLPFGTASYKVVDYCDRRP